MLVLHQYPLNSHIIRQMPGISQIFKHSPNMNPTKLDLQHTKLRKQCTCGTIPDTRSKPTCHHADAIYQNLMHMH